MANITDPQQLFLHNLGAALTMEQTVLEMLKTNEQKAQDDELKQQFSHHRQETEGQIRNLEQETHTRDEVRKQVERVAQQAAQLSGAR